MTKYQDVQTQLQKEPKIWLVTGVAGFIGSNLLEALLKLDQPVVGLDNFSTGKKKNLEEVQALVNPEQWARFRFIEGDITDLAACERACAGVDFVLHQAALGSVPRSIADPLRTHQSNVTGFLNMLVAARDARVKKFVYASSSSVYGDHPDLPKIEHKTGLVLSPYAATKAMNETYADVFARVYGMETVGLRYFNVFGPRQDPEGAYAAVIPLWIAALLKRSPVFINGDGETSRDFCYVANVVQANILAATVPFPLRLGRGEGQGEVSQAAAAIFNIAVGERTTLNELFQLIQEGLLGLDPDLPKQAPVCREFRTGDVLHSLADISKAEELFGYEPTHKVKEGLQQAMKWYRRTVRLNHPSAVSGEQPGSTTAC